MHLAEARPQADVHRPGRLAPGERRRVTGSRLVRSAPGRLSRRRDDAGGRTSKSSRHAPGGGEPQPRQGARDPRSGGAAWAERGLGGGAGSAGARGDRHDVCRQCRAEGRWRRRRAPACRRCPTIPGSRSRRSAARPASIRRAGPGRPRTFRSPCAGWPTSCGPADAWSTTAGAAGQLHGRALPGLARWRDGPLRGQGLRPSRLAAAREQGFRL